MAKKRKCGHTEDENAIHDKAVKMRKYAKMGKSLNVKFIAAAAVILLVSVISVAMFNFNDTEYIVIVTGKDRITESSHDSGENSKTTSKYLVYADDENGNPLVFENTDCFIRGKFNSSNMQGRLKEGHTYRITAVGYRVPFCSWYQNIIKVREDGMEK